MSATVFLAVLQLVDSPLKSSSISSLPLDKNDIFSTTTFLPSAVSEGKMRVKNRKIQFNGWVASCDTLCQATQAKNITKLNSL